MVTIQPILNPAGVSESPSGVLIIALLIILALLYGLDFVRPEGVKQK